MRLFVYYPFALDGQRLGLFTRLDNHNNIHLATTRSGENDPVSINEQSY